MRNRAVGFFAALVLAAWRVQAHELELIVDVALSSPSADVVAVSLPKEAEVGFNVFVRAYLTFIPHARYSWTFE